MSPLADLFLAYAPLRLPRHLSSYMVGVAPLSTTPVVLVGYLAIIFGIEAVMTHRQPYKLKRIFQIRNMFLSLSSALLLAFIIEEIVPQIWTYGIFHALCAVEAWTPVSLGCGPPTFIFSRFRRDWNFITCSTITSNMSSSLIPFFLL
jgi:hypothetical protein